MGKSKYLGPYASTILRLTLSSLTFTLVFLPYKYLWNTKSGKHQILLVLCPTQSPSILVAKHKYSGERATRNLNGALDSKHV